MGMLCLLRAVFHRASRTSLMVAAAVLLLPLSAAADDPEFEMTVHDITIPFNADTGRSPPVYMTVTLGEIVGDDGPTEIAGFRGRFEFDIEYVHASGARPLGSLADYDEDDVHVSGFSSGNITGFSFVLLDGNTFTLEEPTEVLEVEFESQWFNTDELEEVEVVEAEWVAWDGGYSSSPTTVLYDPVFVDIFLTFESVPPEGLENPTITLVPVVPEFTRGDADGNGTTSGFGDGLFLLRWGFLEGAEPACESAADANGDDELSSLTDGLFLLNWAFQEGTAPPSPGPDDCGAAPASKDLHCADPPSGCTVQ